MPTVTISPVYEASEEEIALSLERDKVLAGRNSCEYVFRPGDEYIVYASRTADGHWTTSTCSGTKPLAEAKADLEYFASLPAAEPIGRLYGTIQRTILDDSDPLKTRNVPAAGVAVSLSTGSRRMTATSDAGGRLNVQLPPGDYTVAPVVPDSVHVYGGPKEVTLVARGCAPVSFSLISDGQIEGRVVLDDGSPVKKVTVGVIPVTLPEGTRTPVSFTIAPIATSDAQGHFRIDAILPGTYFLAVNPHGQYGSSPYPTTYFPDGGRDTAIAIDVGDGERKTGYTIIVRD